MSFFKSLIVAVLFISPSVQAAEGSGFGINVGSGFPFLMQAGVNYYMSDQLGFGLSYNRLDISVGDASAELSMPELLVTYRPMANWWFIGAGIGQETLEVTGQADTLGTVTVDVEAMTAILKTGFMWGLENGGFWFGVDLAFIMPMDSKVTITAPGVPTTDQTYIDAIDAADQFGESSYINFTFARLGWIF